MKKTPILIDRAVLRGMPLPALPEESDKDARGQVLVIAGGPSVPGAPLLTGLAALRAGAGKLQLAATRASAFPLGMAAPEAAIVGVFGELDGEIGLHAFDRLAVAARDADSVVIGPGMMNNEVGRLTARLLEAAPDARFVADAAALQGLAELLSPSSRPLVLTPHAGEMAKLLHVSRDEVRRDPPRAARRAAEETGAVIALKGEETLIASPDGRMWLHTGGVVGLGTSGSGDVLAGVIGGLLARGASPEEAAIRGVFIHGLAGQHLTRQVGELGFLAREIVDAIPRALAESCPGTSAVAGQ